MKKIIIGVFMTCLISGVFFLQSSALAEEHPKFDSDPGTNEEHPKFD
ncbi:hypothetical protein H1D32_08755 [Anaerobacillus sp. CMMVII]|nr:hypothetical protein [Anaerobacillus sp. CMMVII]MCT8137837.1 hypothetical protein [Anaerobacillus sp. CMMVII]